MVYQVKLWIEIPHKLIKIALSKMLTDLTSQQNPEIWVKDKLDQSMALASKSLT